MNVSSIPIKHTLAQSCAAVPATVPAISSSPIPSSSHASLPTALSTFSPPPLLAPPQLVLIRAPLEPGKVENFKLTLSGKLFPKKNFFSENDMFVAVFTGQRGTLPSYTKELSSGWYDK